MYNRLKEDTWIKRYIDRERAKEEEIKIGNISKQSRIYIAQPYYPPVRMEKIDLNKNEKLQKYLIIYILLSFTNRWHNNNTETQFIKK